MNKRKNLKGIPALLGMVLLILDSKCALESGQNALELCIKTAIPSLFPFIFLSGLITESLWGSNGSILRFVAGCMNIPYGAESLLISGFLGGYPAGAHSIGEAYRMGYMKKSDAQKLLRFCNNAGPAFIFGMIAPHFQEKWMVWSIWGIHVLSAGMVGAILPCHVNIKNIHPSKTVSTTQNLTNAVKTMGIICGWIILFRILLEFLDRWFLWVLPETIRIVIWGLLELSNGCCSLTQIDNTAVRYVICTAMVSFGGICVFMQTAAVTQGLSLTDYLVGKLLQTGFSILLAFSTIYGYGVPITVCFLCILFLPKMYKKRSSIPEVSVV